MIQTVVRMGFPTAIVLLLGVAPAGPTLAFDVAPARPISVAPSMALEAGGETPSALDASPVATARPMPAPVPLPDPEPAATAAAAFSEATALRPGRFVWKPERGTVGPVEIVVSIPLQRAYVYRGGDLIGVSTVSTGRKGHSTPVGRFDILEKRKKHFSNRYNHAPMPFMQRLTWDGIALHAGEIPGRPASHGCIRLPLDFARHLFGVTRVGASVHILATSPRPEQALAMIRGEYQGMGRAEDAGDR